MANRSCILFLMLIANCEQLLALEDDIKVNLGVGSEYRLGVYSPTVNLFAEGRHSGNYTSSIGFSHSKIYTDVYAGNDSPSYPGYQVNSATSLFIGMKLKGDYISPYIQVGSTLDDFAARAIDNYFDNCTDEKTQEPCEYYGVRTFTLGVSKDNKYADISFYYRQYYIDSNKYGLVRADVLGISAAFNIIGLF